MGLWDFTNEVPAGQIQCIFELLGIFKEDNFNRIICLAIYVLFFLI